MSLAPLAHQFMALFGVGYAGLSLFLSGLLWAHALVQLPAGLILDKLGIYRGFLIAVFIALLANLLPFISPENLGLATSLRFCAGLSSGLMFLAGVKIIGMMAPPEKMAQAQGIQGAAFSLGIMLPYVTLPYLGEDAWRYSYWIPALIMLFLLAASTKLPAKVRHAHSVSNSTASDLWQVVKSVSTSMPIWTIGVFHGFSYGTLNNLGQWLPSILADMDGKGDVAAWSLGTAVVLLIGTMARAFAGGLLRWRSRSFITNTAVLLIAILYIVLGLTGNPWIGLAVGVVLAWLGGANYGSIFSLTGQSVSPAYMATASGFMNLVGNVTNVLLTMILGTVREYTGSFSMALCAAGVVALLVWVAGHRIIRGMDRPPRTLS
ncbi:MFS transporter [Oxalobacter vibrioformis]|uniref:MFS transporter n=1 Tax=Oxalobacter vibrioformis TaxID=933080 RepID=A0A9E9LYZ1_9BURK|nr:MFS transporter [Oxalobacter vibrioformis]WAW10147.1 MFS transporter [Oxalobacter vibrioformis]